MFILVDQSVLVGTVLNQIRTIFNQSLQRHDRDIRRYLQLVLIIYHLSRVSNLMTTWMIFRTWPSRLHPSHRSLLRNASCTDFVLLTVHTTSNPDTCERNKLGFYCRSIGNCSSRVLDDLSAGLRMLS